MDASYKNKEEDISTIKYYKVENVENWIYSVDEENNPSKYFILTMSNKDNAPKVKDLNSPFENLPSTQDTEIIDISKDSPDDQIRYLYNRFLYARSIAEYTKLSDIAKQFNEMKKKR